MSDTASFSPDLWRFLRALKRNNRRDWFEKNRDRYESELAEPALGFISDFGPRLRRISKHFDAIPKKVGGSLFRIYRDVRFSKDKSPYKTHVGIHFRHRDHKTAHAPGFYLHLEPGGSFMGAGMWRPESEPLRQIRTKIAEAPAAWKRAIGSKAFRENLELRGEALVRPPKGFDPEHPLIDDIKRKSYIAVAEIDDDVVVSPQLIDRFEALCKAGAPLARFVCRAVDVPF